MRAGDGDGGGCRDADAKTNAANKGKIIAKRKVGTDIEVTDN